jgi:peptide/nickel transport system ATP-binding protein
VRFEGVELTALSGEPLRQRRLRIQMIFQDPISSLNPRRKVHDIVGESLAIWGKQLGGRSAARIDEALEAVGLDPELVGGRHRHQFSGGQCQRICIARALVPEPKVLICDEPVSALDVSVQAQIINLLEDMKARYGLTMLFIAHDLTVVKNISDRVIVMYLGKICEIGPADELFENPAHPYTRTLLDSIPDPDEATVSSGSIPGELPSPLNPPSGCRFRTRCPRAQARCVSDEPQIRLLDGEHYVACHFPLDGTAAPKRAAAALATSQGTS